MSSVSINVFPDTAGAAAAAATTTSPTNNAKMLIPKIEPKLEPFDEPALTQQVKDHKALCSPYSSASILCSSPRTPSLDPSVTIAETSAMRSSSEHEKVYSEFHRISKLFRTAFAERLGKPGDTDEVDPDWPVIVPVPPEQQVSEVVATRRNKYKELVRATNFRVEDHKYFRDIVRRTRMTHDSLMIMLAIEDGKLRGSPGVKKRLRADLKASALMRQRGLWLNREKRIVGRIPGIEIGDLFLFRMEMCVIGLHGQPRAGIDYLPAIYSTSGEPIATSVIVSGGYEDDVDSGDVIIYTGHGGQDKHFRQCFHQKLEGGNLAMERSMHYGIEVRVIRGVKYQGSHTTKVYVYDGLYRIIGCWFDVGKSGFGVYKYRLWRIQGQPRMGIEILRTADTLKYRPLEVKPKGYLSLDMSNKKEKIPVRVFNDIDSNQEPLNYNYACRTAFPPFAFHQSGGGSGCSCLSDCGDDCFCAMKNGGEFPYNRNGFLVRGKPVVFECGPHCCCPPHCRNRVTQNGLNSRLEVFRSTETIWGVRSLELIHAGAFICEYTGVVLTREQAQILSMNGGKLIYPNRFSDRWTEWGDLSQIFSEYVRPSYPSIAPLDFAMDVSKMRNVACYISHSLTPNVFVQLVLFDHNNLMFPHLMLFALETIPPLRELSLDYGVADEVTGKLAICY